MTPPSRGVDRRPAPAVLPGGVSAAVLVVSAVTLASGAFYASELASVGVTWRGDADEAYGHDVGDLPAALPAWVAFPVGLVMLLSTVFMALLTLVCLPAAGLVAWTELRARRRLRVVTAAALALGVALLALLLTWGGELSVWVLD